MKSLMKPFVAAALLVAPPAFAHHSFAMFDLAKETTLNGTLKEFQWTNPHSWVQILVADGNGGETEWSIEAGTPGMLTRAGWKSNIIKPGDKISVVIHPLRSGESSGSLVRLTLPDGRVIGPGGVAPPLPRKVSPG